LVILIFQASVLTLPDAGPCQPSMVYRYLRTLEGVSPPLALTNLTCQTTAKAFTATREQWPTLLPVPFLTVIIGSLR
jgi:hypothetical protein